MAKKGLRELIWPMLPKEKCQKIDTSDIRYEDFYFDTDNNNEVLRLKVDFLHHIYDDELNRRNDAERKTSYLISSSAITGTLITGVITFFYSKACTLTSKILIFAFVLILLIYICRALYFSILTIKKHTYSMPDVKDVSKVDTEEGYYRNCIEVYVQCIRRNQPVINDIVDCMTIAHECYVRYLYSVIVFVTVAFFASILKDNIPYNISTFLMGTCLWIPAVFIVLIAIVLIIYFW